MFDRRSRILILGTIPSPKSRETGFFYGHPQNRFWRVLAAVLGEAVPASNEEKTALCLRRRIALWDVLSACEIEGAADTSIRNPVPNDLSSLLADSEIRAVFTTGGKAFSLYKRYSQPLTGVPAVPLPSTSPANCARSLESLCEAYQIILTYLED